MVDYVKFEIINMLPEALERHRDLTFISFGVCETSELDTSSVFADYQGLRFKIYSPRKDYKRGIMTVEGSLHKFWNDGRHNYNDFGIMELDEVLCELYSRFNIHPTNCKIRNIEFGVNIHPPDKAGKIIENCLLHKTKPFKWTYVSNNGNYKQVRRENYFIKVYDKQAQYQGKYDVPPTLRFEIKFTRMRDLNNIGISTMQDLLEHGLGSFKERLLKEWQNILFYDYNVLDDTEYRDRYGSVNFWINLKASNFKYHRSMLKGKLSTHLNSTKRAVANLMENKCNKLLGQTDQMTTYNIRCN